MNSAKGTESLGTKSPRQQISLLGTKLNCRHQIGSSKSPDTKSEAQNLQAPNWLHHRLGPWIAIKKNPKVFPAVSTNALDLITHLKFRTNLKTISESTENNFPNLR